MAYVKPVLPVAIAPVVFDSVAVNLQALNQASPVHWKVQLGSYLNGIMKALNSMCFSVAGTAIAGTKAKAKTTNTVQFSIGGFAYTKAGTDNFWTLDTTCNVTNLNWIGIWLCIDASLAASVIAGTQAATQAAIVMPTIPATKCALGYLTLNPTGTGNFVGGTNDLDDGTIVPNAAFYDLTFPGVLTLFT